MEHAEELMHRVRKLADAVGAAREALAHAGDVPLNGPRSFAVDLVRAGHTSHEAHRERESVENMLTALRESLNHAEADVETLHALLDDAIAATGRFAFAGRS